MFELILAIALSAALLALIGTAINLYLLRVDASRTRVEEAQLARSILAMIADDIRGTAIYLPQDTSAIAELMASGTPFDVDSIDDERTGSPGGASGANSADSMGGTTSSLSDGNPSMESSSMSENNEAADGEMPLGLSGTVAELYVDVARLPRREELFGTITGYTNAPMPTRAGATAAMATAAIAPPSDLKTVRYFLRQGEQVAPGGVAATSLAPELQLRAGGLVRQEIPRRARILAEQTGNSAILDAGQVLIAPEVAHLEFRYYGGQQVTDVWDMQEEKSLPLAIEVRIWLASSETPGTADGLQYDVASLIGRAHEYRQTVYLPMSAISGSGPGEPTGESSSSSSSSSSSDSSSSTSSGASSSFSQP